MSKGIRAIMVIVLATMAIAYWVVGVEQQFKVNDDIRLTDQDAYIAFAIEARESGFTYTGARNRMPLYPFLQGLFYEEGMTTPEFFSRGKVVNAVMTLAILLTVYLISAVYLARYDALLFCLIAGFTVFAYKAPYFQADVLYYGLAFIAFILCAECVIKPRWYLGAAAGVVAALAHLAKASAAPLVALAAACLAVHVVLDLRGWFSSPRDRDMPKRLTASTTTMIALIVAFLVVLSPYLVESKDRYGAYFFNVNSTIYIWNDSWRQAKERTGTYGDREGESGKTVDQVSSARRYFETHTPKDVYKRISRGLSAQYANLVHYRVAEYFLVYTLAILLIAVLNARWLLAWVASERRSIALVFAAGYFAGYTVLYSFYAAIASGPRFILSLVLPGLFVCALLTTKRTLNDLTWEGTSRFFDATNSARWFSFLLLLVLGLLLAWELSVRFPQQIGTFNSSE